MVVGFPFWYHMIFAALGSVDQSLLEISCVFLFCFVFLRLFIYFLAGGERIPRRLHTVSAEPNTELELMHCEVMT